MGRALPDPVELTIPRDIAPGAGWSAAMLEMADHIGAYETLLVSEHFGGQELYIPADPTKNPLLPLLGAAKARKISHVYRRETIAIPTAKAAIARAKRASILAAVRARSMTVADAAKVLHVRRDYVSRLVNQTDEGVTAKPIARGNRPDPRQIDMFDL